MPLSERQKIEAFSKMMEALVGLDLDDEQLRLIAEAPDMRAAQNLAVSYGAKTDTIEWARKGAHSEYLADTPLGADYLSGPKAVDPDELAEIEGSPAFQEAQASLDEQSAALEEAQAALFEGLGLLADGTVDPEADISYLGLGDTDPTGYTDIISAPGYTWTYGDEEKRVKSTAYMRGHVDLPGAEFDDIRMYADGDEVSKWAAYSPAMRAAFTKAMIDANMLEAEQFGSYAGDDPSRFSPARRVDGVVQRANAYEGAEFGADPSGTSREQIEAFRIVLGTANYLGTTPMSAIFARGENAKANPTRGSGSGRAAFSVPAALRTIPDYETLQQRTTELMRRAMGREPEDWEMNLLADEMQTQHKAYNEKMIQASREAYNRGQHTVDIEVPDPVDRTQKFFEETYEDEISRRRDVGESAATNNLMMDALTKGSGMVA